jgi:hypothetical protein
MSRWSQDLSGTYRLLDSGPAELFGFLLSATDLIQNTQENQGNGTVNTFPGNESTRNSKGTVGEETQQQRNHGNDASV